MENSPLLSMHQTLSQESNKEGLQTVKIKKEHTQDTLTRYIKDDRKTLQTIQPKVSNQKSSLSKDAVRNSQIKKTKEKIQVFSDPSSPIKPRERISSWEDKGVQTEGKLRTVITPEEEAYDWMVNDEVPESYWKELAEQRRQALDESLHENEMLHTSITELKEENEKLSAMASKADYFAGVIEDLLGNSQTDDGNEEKNEEKKSEDKDVEDAEKLEDASSVKDKDSGDEINSPAEDKQKDDEPIAPRQEKEKD